MRGALRIYLGAAPGVGKTYAMLNEGRRRASRGTDVVVAYVETYGRERTADQIGDLEVIPRHGDEMDVDIVIRRRPEQALVDDLAQRWQAVQKLLDAGIDVVSTVNIQQLESLTDVVERITGVRHTETVPDEVVRAADQVELVDMTPEALRRRMAHGNIYAPDQIDAALGHYFRVGNLAALRELALLWVADRVDESLEEYRARHGITDVWETRERIVVAVTGAPGTEQLIRRAGRIARRSHADLIGVHVQTSSPMATDTDPYRRLLEELGAELHTVTGSDIAESLIDFARSENATQLVLGASARSKFHELLHGSVVNRVIRMSGDIDVHVISHPDPGDRGTQLPQPRPGMTRVPRRRQLLAVGVAAVAYPALTLLLSWQRDHVGLPSVLLLYLVLTLAVSAVGGFVPGLVAALSGFLLANWFFIPPLHHLKISDVEDLLALIVYLGTSGLVSLLVDRLARSRIDARRATAEAEAMAALAGAVAQADGLSILLDRLRETFGMDGASLLRRTDEGWTVDVASGPSPPDRPERAVVVKELGRGLSLAMAGEPLSAQDQRILSALVTQLANAAEARRLSQEASRAESLARANDLRTAILQAVSHDLRTPLASIKASVSSLRHPEISLAASDEDELLLTIEESSDRLNSLISNLLDMSRLQAGAVSPDIRPVGLDEVVAAAIASLGPAGARVQFQVPDDLAPAAADAALLERAVANIVGNAVATDATVVRVEAGAIAGQLHVRIVDNGPGISVRDRERIFEPFQRMVDHGTGVGLGLAISRGFVEAMGGDLLVEDTPGGGVTMDIGLPLAVV